jgi:transposase, IS30 family
VIRLTPEQREHARAMKRDGKSFDEIARELGCCSRTVRRVVYGRRQRPPASSSWSPGEHRLSLQDREEISRGLVAGESLRQIARRLGRSPSTISREVERAGGRAHYRAAKAHHGAYERARRPKRHKLALGRLCDQVSTWLEELWSPEEISKRLSIDFPDDPEMRVSHETIYQSLFVQGRGELRRDLARCLRTGRAKRRPHNRVSGQGHLPGMVMISERPAEVEDRAVPGHWEGDLIIGKNNRSAVGTLVERTTRFVLLLHLPDGREADKVEAAMQSAISKLPQKLVRSITWDQGKEMANHAAFTVATGIPIYFCDPHSPWQRGSNENTNGLLRQYLPKGADLSLLGPTDLDRIAASLNNRPRETLGFMKPLEKLAELVALTG